MCFAVCKVFLGIGEIRSFSPVTMKMMAASATNET